MLQLLGVAPHITRIPEKADSSKYIYAALDQVEYRPSAIFGVLSMVQYVSDNSTCSLHGERALLAVALAIADINGSITSDVSYHSPSYWHNCALMPTFRRSSSYIVVQENEHSDPNTSLVTQK